MTKISKNYIKDLIDNKCLVNEVYPSMEKILEKTQSNNIRLIYGETYDEFGITIDSLKYYFFLSAIHDALEKLGKKATSHVILGDLHSIKNKIVKNKENLFLEGKKRLRPFPLIICNNSSIPA